MAYLETGKAASESMEAYMSALFDDVEKVTTNLPSQTFAWTFVRDPLERALSAYAETDAVTRRLDGASEHKHAINTDVRYVDIPASIDNGAARFIAYLDDVVANRVPLAWRPEHSRPVADFLRDMPGRLKFVGKLEALERDWPALQKHAKLKTFQKTSLPPWIPAAVRPSYDRAKAVPRSDEVLQKVCEVYAADYACFDYERPAACQKHTAMRGQASVMPSPSPIAAAHPDVVLCEQLHLPAGAHVILVNHDLPEAGEVVNGMYRRMLRMVEALSTLGVVVHVVLHEWHKDAPSTMPQQRLYRGSMWQQYDSAVRAAGKQLKLGIVFTTAITMRVSRDLKNEAQRQFRERNAASKNVSGHKSFNTKGLGSAMHDSPSWNDTSLSSVLGTKKFMQQWPEESVMAWNRDQNIPSVVVTDDIHYLRAPAIMAAAGQCDAKVGCGSAFGKWLQWREIELYASAEMVLTVSTEDGKHIDDQFAVREGRARAALWASAGKTYGQTARGWMDYGNSSTNETAMTSNCTPPVVWLPYVEEVTVLSTVRPFDDRGMGLFYVGTAHIAGQRAIEWIVSEVHDTIKQMGRYCQKGDVGHLYVAGSGWEATARMSEPIRDALNQGRLTFLGVLSDEDLEEQIRSFRVFAAPVFNTTGVATKNIFAMARGLPVVTTKDGTQGLGLRCHLCADAVDVEDTVAGFAQRVIVLQENKKLWSSKSVRGLEHAELHFTFAAEKSALRTTFGLETGDNQLETAENQTLPPLVDAYAKPNDRMIELAQDGLHAAKTPACLALADDFKHDGEKALFVDHGIGLQACALETAFERPDSSPPDVGDEQLFSCPLTDKKAALVSEEVRELHRNMLGAGYVRFDDPQQRRLDPVPIGMQGGGGHESRRWPRPGMCEHRPEDVLDLQARITRPSLMKMVNSKRGFEYRPMLKAGSTMMHHVLPCLQPGEWKEVQQNTRSPSNMTLLVLQRDPISRFASGVVELMERIFRQQCPEGPCNSERDKFEVKSVTANVKQTTLWFPMAKALFSNSSEEDFEPASLRRLVRAAALDASCNLNYYGSEHFASQTGLQLQGEMEPGMQADFFDLDELGESIEQLLTSNFIKTVLVKSKPPSKEDLETCLGSVGTANVQVLLTRRRGGHRHTAFSSRTNLADVPKLSMSNMTNHHADVKLPSTAQIVAAIQADPATHLLLRAMYAQDFACNDVQRDLQVHAFGSS